jgi:hypothetical protein
MPKNAKAAGVCLLLVLFSFGLLFNNSDNAALLMSAANQGPFPSDSRFVVYIHRLFVCWLVCQGCCCIGSMLVSC